MSKKIDLTGKVFGRLTVVNEAERRGGRLYWNCQCECVATCVVRGGSLRSGNTTSCGCLHREAVTLHGHRNNLLYAVYRAMLARCYNKSRSDYANYGGRGITVCDRWRNNFQSFYTDMIIGYEKGLCIDRTNVNGSYEPSNCRWVTPQQNNMNRRSEKDSTSKYKGVSWYVKYQKWRVSISKDGKRRSIGYFTDEIEAAKAYNNAAIELFGEFAHLNTFEENLIGEMIHE